MTAGASFPIERQTSRSDGLRKSLYGLPWLAAALQLAHLMALTGLHNPLWFSNFIQVILPLVTLSGCLIQMKVTSNSQERRDWGVLGSAFGIWVIAEVSYLIELYYLPRVAPYSEIDDVLWLFYAVPFFLVLSGCLDGRLSWIRFLDQAQVVACFLVVAILVFSHPASLSFNGAYDIQNLALLLSCGVRYSVSASRSERLKFRNLGIYLSVYSVCAAVGNALGDSGWEMGSIVDLFWTVPMTVFCFVSFKRTGIREVDAYAETKKPNFRGWTRHLHDLSALGLSALSIAASAYLVLSRPVPGSLCLAGCFLLMAMRTYARSVELHLVNDSLQQSVLIDPLTGLGNRSRLQQTLQELAAGAQQGQVCAPVLLFLDLDRFKAINDGLGHEAGDQILIETARRIRQALPADAVLCRLGGDEFVVVLRVSDEHEGKTVSSQIIEAIREPIWLENKLLQISASVGFVMGAATDRPDDLLRKADQAMYRAKKLGKNRIECFDISLDDKRSNFALEEDLRNCLKQRQLQAYLQPICDVRTGEPVGFEALARWRHEELGMVPPTTFIPLAEETGMILELGRQMISQAVQAIASWNRLHGKAAWVSVNVSAVQLSDPELLPFVLETVASVGMDPDLLHLEITESVLLSGDKGLSTTLSEAQRFGIHISLDDFGTGYSSLSYLLNFPTDEIKIDRGFVRGMDKDPRRRELVRTVLHLGASLNKRVIAEGVESEKELESLRSLGCAYVQGYLFGKPVPAESITGYSAMHPRLSVVVDSNMVLNSGLVQ